MSILYTLAYYAVLCWNALPDGVHYNLMPAMRVSFMLLRVLGYTVYEDGSVGW